MSPTAFTSDVTTVASFAAVRQAGRTYRRLSHEMDQVLRPFGLTNARLHVLDVIGASPDGRTCLTDLAADVALHRTTVAAAVQALERAGLALKARSDADQRCRAVTITDTGRRRLRTAMDAMERAHATDPRASLVHPIAATHNLIGPVLDALCTFEESLLGGLDQARRSSIESGLRDLLMRLKNAP